jgi:post-segregation antitoxin (ccd killing protein)
MRLSIATACSPTECACDKDGRWLHENQEAIAHYNRRVAEQGLLSDDAGLL